MLQCHKALLVPWVLSTRVGLIQVEVICQEFRGEVGHHTNSASFNVNVTSAALAQPKMSLSRQRHCCWLSSWV